MTMQGLGYFDAAPDAMKPMVALEASLGHMLISNPLHEVLKTRAPQINGCAFCPNMHLPAARQARVS
ncbi:hypothetical protein ERN12_15495 [Rhodobacteraceae bacterium]|nr:hypothetical protein ERN12_15495 [Paracoccaceae bacterium]